MILFEYYYIIIYYQIKLHMSSDLLDLIIYGQLYIILYNYIS